MNINLLSKLKQKLREEAQLSTIWVFYMDHFADHPEFTNMGEPLHNEQLKMALVKSCQQMFADQAEQVVIAEFMSIYIARHRFFHGPVKIAGRYGGMFYFEDIKMGLVAIPTDPPMVKYSRFSMTEPDLN
jgi:hypothetical protein